MFTQLQNLLTFNRLNKGRVHFVIVFNLTRFACDEYDYFALRSQGITLRSATEPIDDTSTGKLMEGVLAGVRAVQERRALGSHTCWQESGARTPAVELLFGLSAALQARAWAVAAALCHD